jgi:hypothetical protein
LRIWCINGRSPDLYIETKLLISDDSPLPRKFQWFLNFKDKVCESAHIFTVAGAAIDFNNVPF